MKTFFGYTWVGLLNLLVLQWFFIRLAYTIDTKTGAIVSWDILKWVAPLSGWNSDFKYVGKPPQKRPATRKYRRFDTIESILELLDEKNVWKQFVDLEEVNGVYRGTLRRSSLDEIATLIGAKTVNKENVSIDTYKLNGKFTLRPSQMSSHNDLLGYTLTMAAKQSLKQLQRWGGEPEYARFVDWTEISIEPVKNGEEYDLVLKVQFMIWFALTKSGMAPDAPRS